jgi:antibiotic biosynthesis monooxygenase (ABM) superfamily enzyme
MTDRNIRAPAAPPPRYKLALLTWIGVYPVITLLLAVLGPATATWPLPLRTLLLTAVMVPTLTWLVIPTLTRLFRGWLAPGSAPAQGLREMKRQTERT